MNQKYAMIEQRLLVDAVSYLHGETSLILILIKSYFKTQIKQAGSKAISVSY